MADEAAEPGRISRAFQLDKKPEDDGEQGRESGIPVPSSKSKACLGLVKAIFVEHSFET